MSRRRRELLSGLAVVVLFGLPLMPEIVGTRRLIFRDAQVTHWPWRRVATQMLDAGEVPFVNVRASGGEPLLANPNAAVLYPTFLLERVLPPVSAFNLHYLIHVLWAFFGARRLARRLGVEEAPAFLSGVAFAFSGMMLSYGSAFMNSAAAAAWLPWCAAAAAGLAQAPTARERIRAGAALGVSFGLQLLAGEPALSLLTLVLAFLLGLGMALRRESRQPLGFCVGFAAAGLLAVALAAPLLLPLRQVLPLTFRGQHLFSEEAFGAVPLRWWRLAEWLFPRARGNPSVVGLETGWLHARGIEPFVYIWCVTFGVVPFVLLAVAALRREFWHRGSIALSATAAIALLFSFGLTLPLYRVLFWIPSLRRLRYPIKFYLVTTLCVAVLSGLAAQSLSRRRPGRREAAALSGFFAVFAAAWLASAPGGPLLRWVEERARRVGPDSVPLAEAFRSIVHSDAFIGGASVLLVAVLLRFGLRGAGPGYALGFLSLCAALLWGLPLFVSAPSAEIERVPALAPHLQGPGRLYDPVVPEVRLREIDPDFPRRLPRVSKFARLQVEHLFPSTGMPFGVRYLFETDPDGSYGWYNRVAGEAAASSIPAERDRLLRVFGARWVLAHEGDAHPLFRATTGLSIGPERLVLFEDPSPLPELRWAGRSYGRKSLSGALDLLRTEAFDPASELVLRAREDADPAGPTHAARLRDAAAGSDAARVGVDAEGDGHVVWSRTFFPAWKARVDGAAVAVEVANARDLAVAVPAGRHEVEIFYDRGPFRIGVAAQAAGFLAVAWPTAATRLRRAGRGAPAEAGRYRAGSR